MAVLAQKARDPAFTSYTTLRGLQGVPGNSHAQLAVKKEGYVKRAHVIQMCEEVADENVGQAITVRVETKQIKEESGVA